MTEISALFWDNGGVILTNGWDRTSRRAAVEKFHLEWSDFEDRHELMLNAFETGSATWTNICAARFFTASARSLRKISNSSCSRNRSRSRSRCNF